MTQHVDFIKEKLFKNKNKELFHHLLFYAFKAKYIPFIKMSLDYLAENLTAQEMKSFLSLTVGSDSDTILNSVNEESNQEVLHLILHFYKVYDDKYEGLEELRKSLTKKTKL